MRTRLAIKIHTTLERLFPERRIFLKSDSDTRFIRLKPEMQLVAYIGVAAIVGWTIVATAIVVMDTIGASNFRDQAKLDQQLFQDRLNAISSERDMRAAEAVAAQERFNTALAQISRMQSELLASETRRDELATGIDVIQSTLRDTMQDREAARNALAALQEETSEETSRVASSSPEPLNFMSEALEETAVERDRIYADARNAIEQRNEMELELRLLEEKNDQIFGQLEDAMAVSIVPLDEMFKSAGLSTDRLLDQVRRGYSGQGGPLTPLTFSTRGEEPSADEMRANKLLTQMDLLNMYRIAAKKAPFASPIRDAVRYTSGFGYRRDPKTGGRRMHNGSDFAGPMGTNIYATADGVVSHAGWMSGFGRLIKIKHAFGIETYYAHNSKLRVKVGQRVSRGDHISDMGNTGRVTGTHLHYEVRVDGTPVNPMIYIKAANNVFKEQNQRARLQER
ncbi:peptidoglycan DD-metalloendopeptidase family protein [Sulfitobacter sp. BDSS02]|nr:peptidoglycan DD-metalloendopeptidase family protein [Sulfitobacter sp. BDSS02]MBR9850400.1 peptidoglycan DD-metalloendopeptidase family protein [Paracoccaceae bacterium]